MKISELIFTYGFTKDNAIKAMKKQISKKPIENFYGQNCGEDDYDEGYVYSCPACEIEHEVGRYSKSYEIWLWQENYCQKCGQKINWD